MTTTPAPRTDPATLALETFNGKLSIGLRPDTKELFLECVSAAYASLVAQANAAAKLAEVLTKLTGDVRWMLNERKFLSPSAIDFDGIEAALAAHAGETQEGR